MSVEARRLLEERIEAGQAVIDSILKEQKAADRKQECLAEEEKEARRYKRSLEEALAALGGPVEEADDASE